MGDLRDCRMPNIMRLSIRPTEFLMRSIHESTGKTMRHRERMRAAGLRLVQLWVPDTRSSEFAAQLRKQCQSLKNDSAETDVLRFTEEAATCVEGWA
jgi:hypothetical protein